MASLVRGFRSQRSFGANRVKRKTIWGLGPGSTVKTEITASSSVVVGSIFNYAVPGTLVRLRGQLQLYLTAATAADDGFSGAFGIVLVRAAAAAAGIASLPTPLTDVEDQFLYHRFFSVHAPAAFAVTGYASDSMAAAIQIDVDSRAMRKHTPGDSLVAVLEAVERGTSALAIWFDSRQLSKLT